MLGEAGQKPVALTESAVTPWFKIAVGAVLAGQAMLLGLAVNLAPPAGSARWLLHAALIFSSLAALFILGRPLFQTTLEEIRQRRVCIELLFLAGILGALAASIYSTVTGVGAIYYELVAVLLTVYSVGKTLGAQSRARALAETRHLQHTFQTCQKVQPDGTTAATRVSEIRVGDHVRVLPGEPVPIDGRILRGQAFVCETPLTGEPFPVVRRAGDAVFAGSYSEDGEVVIAATADGTERRLDTLLAALESARERPSHIQAQADGVVRWFLPLVLTVSLGTFAFWAVRSGWSVGLFNGLAVLLIACPCAMGLATPVALWNALAALAARGLVVRGGDVIERLAGLDRMVFDKTGTLSEESYSLIDLATLAPPPLRQTITAQLRAVQSACAHPVARAFTLLNQEPAESEPVCPVAFQVRSLKTVPARGVEAWLDSETGGEHHLRIGQRELMSDLSTESELLAQLRRFPSDHLVYVEVDGHLNAIAAVRERLRTSTVTAMRLLEEQGVACAVMTGDRPERAAELLGPARIEGSLTPLDKAGRIEQLRHAGRCVGFVGDGVNDAPALQAATVGVALAHGAGVTTAGADAVLYGGDLRVMSWAVTVCRQVRDSIRSNLIFAAVYNVIGMALAATGLLHPVASALLMVVSSFTVSWRALRSTETGDVCCAGTDARAGGASTLIPTDTSQAPPVGGATFLSPQAPPASGDKNVAAPRFKPSAPVRTGSQTLHGFLVAAQAPFLIYLGHLSLLPALVTSALMVGLGLFILHFRTQNAEVRRLARMTFAMLGPGNWGMILGWWADSGFAPAGLGCAHCAMHGFHFLSLATLPWMNLGMLLLGLPPMIFDPTNLRPGLGRVALAILSAAGMLWGMSFGNHVFLQWLGPITSESFLLSFAGMTLGMLLGMFLCCELGRALSLAWTRRRPGRWTLGATLGKAVGTAKHAK